MKLTRKDRTAIANGLMVIGKDLQETIGGGLRKIADTLLDRGIVADMDRDWALYGGQGRTIHCEMHRWGDEDDRVDGSVLVVQAYRHETGRYELTAYVS